MKVAFKVVKANVAIAAVQMENQYFLITDIAPLCRSMPQYACDGTDVFVYFSIDKTVQSGGTYTGGTFTAAASFQRLDNDKVEVWQGFQQCTVSRFQKGMTYLIPVTSFAPLNIIPNFGMSLVVAGSLAATDQEVISQTMFRYDCAEDSDILNALSIAGCITVEKQGSIEQTAETQRDIRKGIEVATFAQATGNMVVAQQAAQSVQRLAQAAQPDVASRSLAPMLLSRSL